MTRLIDADALHKALYTKQKWVVHRNGKHNEGFTSDQVHFAIDAQPTIDAIPIEFIQKRIDQLKEMNGFIFEYEQWELERLVRKWREENATAD